MKLLDRINQGLVYFDGGFGSLLQEKGLKPGELPETYNILHPQMVSDIHYEYLMAGSQIISTNTFGANRLKFEQYGEFALEMVLLAAIENVRTAIKRAGKVQGEDAYIALDLAATGKMLEPLGDLPFEEAVSIFGEIVRLGCKYNVDCILVETMNDGYEAKAAVLGAKENSDLPIFVTTVYDENGKSMTAGTPETMVAMMEGLGVSAIGLNCSLGPEKMIPIVKRLSAAASIPVIANPNAGLPTVVDGKTVYQVTPELFGKQMKEIVEAGARIVGGCCGTTPRHIGELIHETMDMQPLPLTDKNKTVISSYSHTVEFGKKPILIGERINPTGKSKFKQALRDHNIDYILQEGFREQDKKVQVLDVNVGLPEIDEVSILQEVVVQLQSVIDLPLQIDTSDPAAMETAMRLYNGKPMVNSVNGKEECMNQVFPLIKKYGGVVVALTLDENGIPETAQGRLDIAKKIYAKAKKYGIPEKDIIVDVLTMSVSTDERAALTTLEAVRGIKETLKGKTSLGVSNVSFGLPNRGFINTAFFTQALANGLDAAIMNPNSDDMMKAYYSFCALNGYDSQCQGYIEFATNFVAKTAVVSAAKSVGVAAPVAGNSGQMENKANTPLTDAIIKGMKDAAGRITSELMESKKPLDIIDGELIPALNYVGKRFEEKTMFLPQLLMSAEAASAAFDVIKKVLEKRGEKGESKGKVIVATVKGDIHDIGKNIVKVLLENYGYQVFDLGKDVAPEKIVEVAKNENVKLVGLSALMTTTVPAMEETIKQLRAQVPDCKVMVGGAVLTQEYADMVGADAYCKDAMGSVRYAEGLTL